MSQEGFNFFCSVGFRETGPRPIHSDSTQRLAFILYIEDLRLTMLLNNCAATFEAKYLKYLRENVNLEINWVQKHITLDFHKSLK